MKSSSATELVLWILLLQYSYAAATSWSWKRLIARARRQTTTPGYPACPDPGIPENGHRIGALFYPGFRLIFGCNTGYTLVGSEVLNCRYSTYDIYWDAPTPYCISERVSSQLQLGDTDPCGPPPQAGTFAFISNYSVGALVQYRCMNGYVRQSGSEELTCMDNEREGEPLKCRRLGKCTDYGSARIQNGYRTIEGTTEGDMVAFGCNNGYDLIGNRQLTCGSDGVWIGAWPTCARVPAECGDPSTPVMGSRMLTGTTQGSTVDYSCQSPGYVLRGNSRKTCQQNGQWSGDSPVCERVSCAQPRRPTQGSVRFTSTVYGSAASYHCNAGFILNGASSAVCNTDGQWSRQPPTCRLVICGALRPPRNGRVTAPSRSYGSMATYGCSDGYALVGAQARVCQPNGVWSHSIPSCRSGSCSSLSSPKNGRVFYSNRRINSVARYTCNHGYHISGSWQRVCRADGWTGTAPICNPNPCPMLSTPRNGQVAMTNENLFGSIATYSCDFGFRMIGTGTRQCQPTGIWTETPPGCYEVNCGPPRDLHNGMIQFDSTGLGSEATYVCNPGFRLAFGDRIRTCTIKGYWSGTMPCCIMVEITCELLEDPENGRVIQPSRIAGAVARYECNPGFTLVGTETRTCSASGIWSGEAPVCIVTVTCPSLPNPGNGIVDVRGNQPGDTAVYSCNPGFTLDGEGARTCVEDGEWSGDEPTCITVLCPELPSPGNGTVQLDSRRVNETATYTCDVGFVRVGPRVRECMPNGEWSNQAPTCEIINCGVLFDPANGRVILPATTFGSVANYTCNDRYRLNGTETRTCTNTGTWSGEEPVCKLIRCETLVPPSNGNLSLSDDNVIGSVARYECDPGYVAVGRLTIRTCTETGWTGVAPSCELIVDCGPLDDPANGGVLLLNTTTGSSAVYRCDDGFTINGTDVRICQSSGQWSGEAPVCDRDPFMCPQLDPPTNGTLSLTNGTFIDSQAFYDCENGFQLVGDAMRVCGAGGWTGNDPACIPFMCPQLDPPTNGILSLTNETFIDSQAFYDCENGFQLVGDAMRVCGAGGWTGNDPACLPILCPNLTAPTNGSVDVPLQIFGAVATYTCNSPYTLVGISRRLCMSNGQWEGEPPTCELIECPILENPENGQVTMEGNIPGLVATYSCNSGYAVVGNGTRVCGIDGMWSGTAPTCQVVMCPELPSPANGVVQVECRRADQVCRAVYICNDGFERVGPLVRECTPSGEWSNEAPTCQRQCPDLVDPLNGTVNQGGVIPGSIATYSCDPTYRVVPPQFETRECMENGQWSGQDPICELVMCPILDDPLNGNVQFDVSRVPTTMAVYMCDTGFDRNGVLLRRCQQNGMWTQVPPVCDPLEGTVTCPSLTVPDRGALDLSTTTVGSVASYTCDTGYVLVGPSERVCQSSMTWTGSDPVCNPVDCGPLDDPVDGRVILRNTTLRSRASYVCDSGFIPSGDPIRFCLSSGLWSGVPPTCEPLDCGSLPDPLNGMVDTQPATTFGSVASYSCSDGFTLQRNNGEDTRICTEAGIWSGEEPTCEFDTGVIDCGDPGEPENGFTLLTATTVGSRLEHGCDEGNMFQSTTSQFRECLQSGQWTGELPQCIPVICPNLQPPENGRVFDPVIAGFESLAPYFCNPGFMRVGVFVRTCQSDGTWSGEEPVCILIECPVLGNPPNGMVVLSGRTVGSIANYSCLPTLTLTGVMIRECQNTGQWSDQAPSCEIVGCPVLEDPINGTVVVSGRTVGSVANYTCVSGHLLTGVMIRECLVTGEWSDQAPICERRCPDLQTPANSRRVGNNFTAGMRVYFVCADGYETRDQQILLCQEGGAWDADPPVCTAANGSCMGTDQVMDQFGRRCTCINGQFDLCSRFRRDWSRLNDEEKQTYISAVLTIATDPQYRPLYNQLIQIYSDSALTPAQNTTPDTSQFLPWHRYFLLEYEDLLRLVNSSITIPYWDWSLLPTDPYSSPVFDPVTGFGNSSNNITMCVTSGPFRDELFQVTPSAGGDCLRRKYKDSIYPSRSRLNNDLPRFTAADFSAFHQYLQLFVHLNVRCFVGGDLCTYDAANDPLYLLHLSRIDLSLDEWQSIDSARSSVRYENDNTELAINLDGSLTVSDFSSNSDLPFGVSILYAPLQSIPFSAEPPTDDLGTPLPPIGGGPNSTETPIVQNDDPGARVRQPDNEARHCISESLINELLPLNQDRNFLRSVCSRYDG